MKNFILKIERIIISQRVAMALMVCAFVYMFYCIYFSGASTVEIVSSTLLGSASAILLYVTLITQKEELNMQRISFDQERFESTFFKFLEYYNKIRASLYVSFVHFTAGTIKSIKSEGVAFFHDSCVQIGIIEKSLQSDKYLGREIDIEIVKHEDYMRGMLCCSTREDMYNDDYLGKNPAHCKEVLANDTYGISRGAYEGARNNSDEIKKKSYLFFYSKYCKSYDLYLRNLKQLLLFINSRTNSQEYYNILLAQMSKEEIEFLKYHALSDNQFGVLAKTIFSKIDLGN